MKAQTAKATKAIKAIASTSKWETDRVNGGVTGVGHTSICFEIDGVKFNVCIHRLSKLINPNNWERSSTGYKDTWTGATAGNYQQELLLPIEKIPALLADVFEYENTPLKPYRFRQSMVQAVKAYAKIKGKDLRIFVCGYLFPMPHPHYQGDSSEEYAVKREEVLKMFNF